jgi:CYTH domain-containing protein
MSQEIEKRFLVDLPPDRLLEILKNAISVTKLTQCYLTTDPKCTIRVRIVEYLTTPDVANCAYLTIKSLKDVQGSGVEYEYPIPIKDARELNALTPYSVTKKRYHIPLEQLMIELDVFEDKHQGLVIAEIELLDVNTKIPQVVWLNRDITTDYRYSNLNLAIHNLAHRL